MGRRIGGKRTSTQESNKLLHLFNNEGSCGLLLSYFPIGEKNNGSKVKMNNVESKEK